MISFVKTLEAMVQLTKEGPRVFSIFLLAYTPIAKYKFACYRSGTMSRRTPTSGMSLQEWKDLQGISWSAFARLVPCSHPYPRMIASGQVRPSYAMAVRIEAITNGAVPRSQWYPPEDDFIADKNKEVGDMEI